MARVHNSPQQIRTGLTSRCRPIRTAKHGGCVVTRKRTIILIATLTALAAILVAGTGYARSLSADEDVAPAAFDCGDLDMNAMHESMYGSGDAGSCHGGDGTTGSMMGGFGGVMGGFGGMYSGGGLMRMGF